MSAATSMAAFLVFASVVAFAQDAKPVYEFDPGVGVAVDLTRVTRLDFFVGREKSEEIHSSKGKLSAGASFRLKPLFKTFLDNYDRDKEHLLVLAAAFEFSRGSDSTSTTLERKLMLDSTVRFTFFRRLLVSDRNRFEFRWINGAYSFRYRNRPMVERPFRVKKRKYITPYLAVEPFWDSRYDKWSQFKFTGGVQIPMIRRSILDLYYERQHCVVCADAHTNIFGITLNMYLRTKN